MDTGNSNIPKTMSRNKKNSFTMRRLRLSLKYRPEILKLVLRMRQCIRNKNNLLKKLSHQLKSVIQPKEPLVYPAKDKCIGSDSSGKTGKNIEHTEKDLTSASQGSCTTQTAVITNHNSGSIITNMNTTGIDKGTSSELSVKHSFSQTKNYNCVHIKHDLKEDNMSRLLDMKQNTAEDNLMLDSLHLITESKEGTTTKDTLSKNIENNLHSGDPIPKDTFTMTEPSLNVKETKIQGYNLKDSYTQTENIEICNKESISVDKVSKDQNPIGWTNSANGDEEKSIAEQVKEVAQNAMQQSGMVYVESAGMYYDYKTGYYYNSELGLYYHTDTGCYYYYSDDQKTFVFHSYPDRSIETYKGTVKPIRKPKKHKKDEDKADPRKRKRKKLTKHKTSKKIKESDSSKDTNKTNDNRKDEVNTEQDTNKEDDTEKIEDIEKNQELEDGECSDTGSEESDIGLPVKHSSSSEESDGSTATASDDESVAKHHPPCMRIIVRETNLPKLKVGSLFLVTKDGGTIGREGDHHAILLKDYNVSRNHLDIKFDTDKRFYTAVDLGSKNGTVLNGVRMSESQEISSPMEVVHGSTIQLGETKLLCHIHAGNDTCGHCEPGLIMEAEEAEKKVAYTRTCSVQVQHQLELARLKNKYAPQPLALEETAYNDRAQARRETVGSSHHSEKTQSSDVNTFIAADNKGFKLLEKMGWSKGEGLGKECQGDTEPIPLINNEGKSGLGASPAPAPLPAGRLGPATLRLAARTKMLKPPAKAFQHPMEDDSE